MCQHERRTVATLLRCLSLTDPDPRKLGEPADDPSPALAGTLSPSDGERDGVHCR
jgi:hypothetical protein